MTLNYCTHPTPLGKLLLVTRNGASSTSGYQGKTSNRPAPQPSEPTTPGRTTRANTSAPSPSNSTNTSAASEPRST